jgi:aldehyde dehydrogenase (NAD+)
VAAVSGAEFDNVSPATGLVLGSTAAAEAPDMERAIASARRAFDETDWSCNGWLRKRCLEQLQTALEVENEELREELIAEVGCAAMTTQTAQLDLAVGRGAALPRPADRRVRMGTHPRRRWLVR